MGFSRAIVAGTVLGGVAAAGIYVAVAAPAASPPKQAAYPAAETAERASALRPRPVPAFTKVVQAPCAAPSVLDHGVCVTHVAGAPTYLPAAAPAASAATAGSRSAASGTTAAAGSTPTSTPSAAVTGKAPADEPEDSEQAREDAGHEKGEGTHPGDDDGAPDGG